MLRVTLLALFVAQASAFYRDPLPPPPEDQLALLAARPKADDQGQCVDLKLNYCQGRFSESLGLDATVGWRQADVLLKRLQELTSANETSLLTTCAKRAAFYQCLGEQYYSCVSLFGLMPKAKNRTEVNMAYTYVDTLRSGDFLCNSGFEEVVNQYECLLNAPTLPQFKTCVSQYQTNLNTMPFCDAVNTAGLCFNGAYAASCTRDPRGAGWFGCEDFMQSYLDLCIPPPRCFVH